MSQRKSSSAAEALPRAAARPVIPRTIWVLGFVSLFMDLSSELVHSLMPIFLVGTLGASVLTVGIIEGIAEATALIVKVFSGAISDFVGRRKGLMLLGYGLAALTKPLFPLASSVETVFVARFLDRIGKGLRGAPRDALVADVAPPAIRGACFGLRQSMDTVGAFLGPALAIGLMIVFGGNIISVLWVAVLPAVLCVALIIFGIDEPGHADTPHRFHSPVRLHVLRNFSRAYWGVVAIGALFTLARFSEAFLILRAQQTGFTASWVPLVMVLMALFYMLSAYPAGKWSDRVSRRALLSAGLGLLMLADLVLARADSVAMILVGVALWGLHMGFSQGLLAAMVADTAPPQLKGSAFGVFNLISGISMLVASVLAGWLWQTYSAAVTFYAGAAISALALLLLLFRRGEQGRDLTRPSST